MFFTAYKKIFYIFKESYTDSNSYPWLLFYSQPHSITVNWFDVSTALSPHNMSVWHLLEEQIANEDNSYTIKTVKYKSYHEK